MSRELTTEEIESVNECPKCGCDFSVGYNGDHFECFEVDCKHKWTLKKKEMKRTYKLIKEYPNSPALGTTTDYDSFDINEYEEVDAYPEFWELQEQKREYRITVVRNKLGTTIKPNIDENASWFSINYELVEALRLSDNKEFSIGDRVVQPNCPTNSFTITGFTEKKGYPEQLLVLGGNGAINLNKIEKEEPVMTTVDLVDIYYGDDVYFLRVKNGISLEPLHTYGKYGWARHGKHCLDGTYLWFSSEKAVKNYLKNNETLYTLNDVESALDSFSRNIHFKFNKDMIIEKLKSLK